MFQSRQWYWGLVGLLLLLLGLSVSANQVLWLRAKDHYIGANATRLDPLGLKAFRDAENPVRDDRVRVVFFGDSRAASWPVPVDLPVDVPVDMPVDGPDSDNSTLAGYEFFNRGLGSQTSVQALERFQAHVSPLQPDVVVIQVGINDIKAIGLFPHQTPTILANVHSNIDQLVTQAEATGAVVILSSIFPMGAVPLGRRFSLRSHPFWLSDAINPAVTQVNQSLKAMTIAYKNDSVIWFDSAAAIADEQGHIKSEYLADELHLNERGYSVLNQALIAELDRIAKHRIAQKEMSREPRLR